MCFLTSETSPREETGIMIVSGLSDCPNRGEERIRRERRMSIWIKRVPISELGEPNIYHNLDHFTRNWDFTLSLSDSVKN